jgi:hypothetical protein
MAVMTDLIERLRRKESVFVAKDCKEAADRIESDKATIEGYRTGLAAGHRTILDLEATIERLTATIIEARRRVFFGRSGNALKLMDEALAAKD